MKDIRYTIAKLVDAYEDTQSTMAPGAAQVESGQSVASTYLFLWAVLMNHFELARCMWEKVEEPVPNALLACGIFKAMQLRQDNLEGDIFRKPTVLQKHAE